MSTRINPTSVHPPLGNYSHTVAVPGDAEWLTISGQVGIDKSGKIARGIEKQTERAFRNILACLKSRDMAPEDLVKLTVFLTDSRYVEGYRIGRDKVLGTSTPPASTLIIVAGLASPDLFVEVEASAAKVRD